MSHRKLLLILPLLAASAVFAKPKAKAPPPAPAVAKMCEECHGANGVAVKPGVPHLDGQLPEYIVESMDKLKNGKRPSSTAVHASPELTDADIEALAKFYGAQKGQRPAQAVDAAKVSEAAPLYKRRCTKCHLDNGREADHDAPLMAAQSLEYLQAQTEAFATGKRKFPFLMDEAYQGLTREDLERLSHFFASQPQNQ